MRVESPALVPEHARHLERLAMAPGDGGTSAPLRAARTRFLRRNSGSRFSAFLRLDKPAYPLDRLLAPRSATRAATSLIARPLRALRKRDRRRRGRFSLPPKAARSAKIASRPEFTAPHGTVSPKICKFPQKESLQNAPALRKRLLYLKPSQRKPGRNSFNC